MEAAPQQVPTAEQTAHTAMMLRNIKQLILDSLGFKGESLINVSNALAWLEMMANEIELKKPELVKEEK